MPRPKLSNAEQAVVDMRKFTAYSMDPGNPRNRGKWKAWDQLGYDVGQHRDEAAADVVRQLRGLLPDAEVVDEEDTAYGTRRTTETVVVGPNGRAGTLICVWQYDTGTTRPRMVTHWVEVHRGGTP